jgi:hypothetical protein
MWDSLANADSSVKGSALDFLTKMGDWPVFDALGDVGLGAGVFTIGWQIGKSIADLLGIDSDTNGSGGVYREQPYGGLSSLVAVSAGTTLPAWPGPGCPDGPGTCTLTGATAPADGWIVNWGTTGEVVAVPPWTVYNVPKGTQTLQSCIGAGNHPSCDVYFIPATVAALPGPGQGAGGESQGSTGGAAGFTFPSEAQQKQSASSILRSGAYDGFNQYECAEMGPSGPCSFWSLVPAPSANESASGYAGQLTQAGLQANVTTLSETDTTVGDGDVVETNPEQGSVVAPDSTVDVAANPPQPQVSKQDSRCDMDNGSGSPGDPGPAPADGTAYPPYQLVQGSPYQAGVDPTNASPPQTAIPLRWGRKDWGWRHILQNHPYSSADMQQTVEALATDSNPTLRFSSTNQWVFHYFYTAPDGQGGGGTITCLRSVPVEYWQDPRAGNNGVTGIRGIQNSYVGLYLGGLAGH